MVRVDTDFSATPAQGEDFQRGAVASSLWLEESAHSADATSGWSSAVAIPHSGTGAVSVRLHHGDPQSAKPKGEVVADILASIKERPA